MEYHEAATVLFELRQFRPRPGTSSTRDLLSVLGDPHESFRSIQIAGTNGKGSTARMTESILRTAGLSVGLYTSPHFDDVRERFRVDGRKIPKATVVRFVDTVREYLADRAADGDPVTFFEATTALALWYFAERDVDIAVLEVGIGGKYDATSVVDPVAAAVTNVGLDHTDILGETIEAIAHDKAHVAPADGPLVTGATGDAWATIAETVGHDNLLTVGNADADVTVSYGGRDGVESCVTIGAPTWSTTARLPLVGEYQAVNAGIAAVLATRVASVAPDTIATGLGRAYWPGRCEVMDRAPLVLLDGAHNPPACARLADVLAEFAYDRLLVVVGAMDDKDHAAMAAALPTPDVAYATKPTPERAADPVAIGGVLASAGVGEVDVIPGVEAAVARALAAAGPDDCVVVTGSLYTVAAARRRWVRPLVPKRIRTPADARAAVRAADVTTDAMTRELEHRVVATRTGQDQALPLEAAFRDAGGRVARSGIDAAVEEPVDLLCSGTNAEFERALGDLATDDRVGPLAASLARIDARPTVAPGHPWADRTVVMGVLNVTPDSFHDGGEYDVPAAAIERAEEMVAAGASIVDVGGESTRPGAAPVDVATERDRVLPVIEAIADMDVMVSIDTRRASVAADAIDAGADMVNDVSGLHDPDMRHVVAGADVPVVLMHSIDTPVVPDRRVVYDDVVGDVIDELTERVRLAEQAGIDRGDILVDPGLGFGKTAAESFTLLGRAGELHGLGCAVLVGHSHKSMFEHIGRGPDERFAPTVAGTAIAVAAGADVIRVHDVAPNVAAVDAVLATRSG